MSSPLSSENTKGELSFKAIKSDRSMVLLLSFRNRAVQQVIWEHPNCLTLSPCSLVAKVNTWMPSVRTDKHFSTEAAAQIRLTHGSGILSKDGRNGGRNSATPCAAFALHFTGTLFPDPSGRGIAMTTSCHLTFSPSPVGNVVSHTRFLASFFQSTSTTSKWLAKLPRFEKAGN